jgi:cytochrome c oxidase assembly factor CtaG
MGSLRCAASGITVAASIFMPASIATAHGMASPAPTLPDMLTAWSIDPLPWTGSLLGAVVYLIAVHKVNRAHPRVPVPPRRVVAWLAGLSVILIALVSPIDRYAEELLSVHMIQHLLLSMVAPPLLALGAPITLALRVARPRTRQRVILPVLHSRVVQLLASPPAAWALFTVAMVGTHFSPLYDAALEDPGLHVAEHAIYLATGVLFWWPIVASDPVPRRMPYLLRAAYVVLQMPVSAAVGLAIYFAPTVLYRHYETLSRTWGPNAHTDQQIGGMLMWGIGDVLLLLTIPVIVAAWMEAVDVVAARTDARLGAARAAATRDQAESRPAGS